MGKKKKDTEKVVYYDDNSTIADMSNVTRLGQRKPKEQSPYPRRKSTFKEKWRTYWSAVKMMLFPTLIALLALGIVYLIIRLAV